jgi:predicted Zn-dependent protease
MKAQADLMGSHIMAEEGYDPHQMARFFEKLNAKGDFTTIQFFSDHPNPANRSKATEEESLRLPQRTYGGQTGQFPQMKNAVANIHEKQPHVDAQRQ